MSNSFGGSATKSFGDMERPVENNSSSKIDGPTALQAAIDKKLATPAPENPHGAEHMVYRGVNYVWSKNVKRWISQKE